MTPAILVINAGSSSLKFSLYRREDGPGLVELVRGQIEGIGNSPLMTVSGPGQESVFETVLAAGEVRDARAALHRVVEWLAASSQDEQITAVGHRVVHGGMKYIHPVVATPPIMQELRELIPLAPLHQPYNLSGIEAVSEMMPGIPQVACFDTSFHSGHAEVTRLIALPWEIYQGGVKRYGFHGLSYEYIASVLPEVAPRLAKGKVIVAHLGSGASLCALDALHSVETTLSFTALDGLCMGTRPGAMDPGALLYLFQSMKLTVAEVETILYKRSGLLGISGISNDMRVLLESQEPRARLAIDFFVYRIRKELGALAAVLQGLDGLVFTAGIGERSPQIRQQVCAAAAWLGVELDEEANLRGERCISRPASPVGVYVIPTNEEFMIARHTARLVN